MRKKKSDKRNLLATSNTAHECSTTHTTRARECEPATSNDLSLPSLSLGGVVDGSGGCFCGGDCCCGCCGGCGGCGWVVVVGGQDVLVGGTTTTTTTATTTSAT